MRSVGVPDLQILGDPVTAMFLTWQLPFDDCQ